MGSVNRSARFIAGLAAIFGAILATAPGAQAAAHGCRYATTSISYANYGASATYFQYVRDAAYVWNVSGAETNFWEGSGTNKIKVYSASYASSWWGLTSWGCSTGIYTGNSTTVQYNERTMGGLGTSDRQRVAVHETGHSAGLADESLHCSPLSIMNSDPTYVRYACGSSSLGPFAANVADVNAIYP